MIKKQDIVCVSSIDWDFLWQGHQEIMSAFAKNGNRVLFIENTGVRTPTLTDIRRLMKRVNDWFKSVRGFRKEMENLYVYSPIILPFPYSKIARYINRYLLINPLKRWMGVMKFSEPIIWTFLPTGTAIDIVRSVDSKLLVYYCIADFYELADSPKKIRETEDELIRESDLIFAQGLVLKEKCSRLNSNVHIFPFGVKMEIFDDYKKTISTTPEDLRGIKHPIIGYVGGIHRHIDFELIKFIAERHPDWSIVLVGPEQVDVTDLNNLKNLFLIGKRDFSSLPAYIGEFDACIIPYEVSGYTETVFPTKLNEYHAVGKPVVSTKLPEVAEFNKENDNVVLIGDTYEEFESRIKEALDGKGDDALISRRIMSAQKNSWAARIEKMSGLIEAALESKAKGPSDWKESFLKLYRVTRRKILNIAIPILIGYVLIFHTDAVWFMAKPLKISQAPSKADCIVVFGGGVGESGKAGQGYEERVGYAVELYKKGYARNLIFSSGYKYFFDETLLMKALAVALGVPENGIILEDKSSNTHENVKFTQEMIKRKGWKSIMVVSSPYHMKRVSLVFDKSNAGVDISYTPLPKSSFYSRPAGHLFERKISLRQIRGIIHEYLGIVYYRWKGWI